jgi:hypothetical protein
VAQPRKTIHSVAAVILSIPRHRVGLKPNVRSDYLRASPKAHEIKCTNTGIVP